MNRACSQCRGDARVAESSLHPPPWLDTVSLEDVGNDLSPHPEMGNWSDNFLGVKLDRSNKNSVAQLQYSSSGLERAQLADLIASTDGRLSTPYVDGSF